MSTTTAPARIAATISFGHELGGAGRPARAPTRSRGRPRAPAARASSRSDISVMIRPLWIWSTNRSRSRFLSTTMTSASMPAAIQAAFEPAIPAPSTTTFAGAHPGAPRRSGPRGRPSPSPEVRADVRRHPARDLAHRRQQRQAAVRQLHGLVRDRRDLALDQRLRELASAARWRYVNRTWPSRRCSNS